MFFSARMAFLICLSMQSPGINLQHKRDGETGMMVSMYNRDKTCHDCFCNIFDRSSYSGLV